MVALHATDPASVYLSALARMPAMPQREMTAALYDDRTLVRMLGMRRTMFVVPTPFVPVVQHSSSDAVAARLRTRLVKELAAVVDGDAERWLADVEDAVVDLLRSDGPALAAELSKAEPRLRTQLMFGPADKAYGGPQAITSRVLNLLSAQSRIIRGRPTNGWAGSRYRWEVVESWLPDGLPRMPAPAARAELVRSWLGRFGPGTLADLVWWTGWNQRDAKSALAALTWSRSNSTTAPRVSCSPTTPTRCPRPSRGSRSCRRSTRRRWAGRAATGTCPMRTVASCSTATATSARASGPTAGSSAAGRRHRPGTCDGGCSRTSAPSAPPRSRRGRRHSPTGTPASQWSRSSAPRCSTPCAAADPPHGSFGPAPGPDSVIRMDLPRPDIDPGGLLEYSVVFTDRSLNHMSRRFVAVMQEAIGILTTTYAADTVALVPGGGSYGMEAVARQLMTGKRVVVVRNGFFSYRWSQILEQGGIAESVTVCRAQPASGEAHSAWTPPPVEAVVEAIRRERPAVVCAAHVETASGILLPDEYVRAVADATHEVGGLLVLDCIASGSLWVDMRALGVDVLLSAPQKGWSGTPCTGYVMLNAAAGRR